MLWTPVSKIIRAYLIEEEIGLAYAVDAVWPIATLAKPDKPINVITIYDEAALKRFRTKSSGVVEDPQITIEVRSAKPEEGLSKAQEIQEAMDSLNMWSWTGGEEGKVQTVVFGTARRSRGIFPLGLDENQRHCFNLNYALTVQSVTEEQ